MLDALVTAVDNKDRYTRRHSEDVLTYSLQIARALGLDEATQHTRRRRRPAARRRQDRRPRRHPAQARAR